MHADAPDLDEIRPAHAAAVLYPTLVAGVWLLVLLGATWVLCQAAGGPASSVVLGLGGVGGLLLALGFLQDRARWQKTRLVIRPGHLIFETGGLGYRSSTQLALRNITHLGHELPIVESRVLGTGSLRVESAGSGAAEIDLHHLADPRAAFGRVLQAMGEAGIAIESRGQLAEERPAMLGVALGLVGPILALLFFVVCMGGGVAAAAYDSGGAVPVAVQLAVGLFGLAGLAALAAWVAVAVLDAREQRFLLMDQSVTFYGGLPERTTVIPMGNIADSRVIQGLVDRVLGLWTVKISCQGAGNEITLANLRGGEAFSLRLGEHLRDTKKVAADRAYAASLAQPAAGPGVAAHRPPMDRDRKFEGSYRMTLTKNLAMPVLGLLVFGSIALAWGCLGSIQGEDAQEAFMWLVIFTLCCAGGIVRRTLEVFCTTFTVGSDEVTEHYKFLGTRTKTFSFDKVTSIRVLRDPFDWLLGTMTIKFASIGSAAELAFRAVPWQEDLEALLLTKIGIQPQEPVLSLASRFSPGLMLRAQPAWAVLASLFGLGVVAALASGSPGGAVGGVVVFLLLAVPSLVYQTLFFRTSRLHFLDHSVLFERGVVIRERTHVGYENIKDLTCTRYPFSSFGELKVDVAGETLAAPPGQDQEQQQEVPAWARQAALSSNAFTIAFVPHALEEALFFDLLQIQRPARQDFAELRARAFAGESLPAVLEEGVSMPRRLVAPLAAAVATVVFMGFLFASGALPVPVAFALALPLIAGLAGYAAYLGTIRFVIEPGAVARYAGLFFKSRTSITFDQIDFINVAQGVVDQAFGTGSVHVHTTGSSKAEMILGGFRAFEEFGARLKAASKGEAAS